MALKEGELYNVDNTRKALHKYVEATEMFDQIVVPQKTLDDPRYIELEVHVTGKPAETAEVGLEWQVPIESFSRLMAPDGSLEYHNRKCGGHGTHLSAMYHYHQLVDLTLKVDLKRPHCFGTGDA